MASGRSTDVCRPLGPALLFLSMWWGGSSPAHSQVTAPGPARGGRAVTSAASSPYAHFEVGPHEPLVVSPDGDWLYVLNEADHRVEWVRLFDQGAFVNRLDGALFTGLHPVSMLLDPTDPNRLFVANHLSDTVSVIDLITRQVVATPYVGDEPIGMAVEQGRLFVACSRAPVVQPGPADADLGPFVEHCVVVLNAVSPYERVAVVPIPGARPRDVVAHAGKVSVIPQDSGNKTTLLSETDADDLGIDQLTTDRFQAFIAVNPVLLRPELNDGTKAPGWGVPPAGRIVFDFEYPSLVPQLADDDLFTIDATTLTLDVPTTKGIGTTLFDLERNAGADELWVAGTEAINRFRFEPFIRGVGVENRVSVVSSAGVLSRVIALQPPAFPRDYAQPVDVELSGGASPRAFVAALGASAIVVLDVASGSFLEEIPTSGLPSGIAYDPAHEVLTVYTRSDHAVQSFDVSGPAVALAPPAPLSFDPEPPLLRRGRVHLYDASFATGHSGGRLSCASCHIFGHTDGLAWDLGDPEGSLSYVYPLALTGPKSFDGAVAVDFATPVVHPMKGPLVTQTLRGLLADSDGGPDLPLHSRGDRPILHAFQPSFRTLLDGGGVSDEATQELATFLRFVRATPNPRQDRDRVWRGDADLGRDLFGLNESFEGKEYEAGSGLSCIDCHQAETDGGTNYLGANQAVAHIGFSQTFNTSSLRALAEKETKLLTGFGLLHDGEAASVRDFLDFDQPRGGPPFFPALTATDKDQLAAFVREWDGGLGPLVGVQWTVDATNDAEASAFFSLVTPQAEAAVPHVDLILKGWRFGDQGERLPRGALYTFDEASSTWGFQFDTGDFVDVDTVILVARIGLGVWTFTCVPPGMGQRLGIDRDEDGAFDEQERLAGTDATDPDSDDDGYTDGFERSVGSDGRRFDASLPDRTPPIAVEHAAREVSAHSGTLEVLWSEPVRLRVRLGTQPGAADVGRLTVRERRASHAVLLADLPAGTDVYYEVTGVDAAGQLGRASGAFTTFPARWHVEDVSLDVVGAGPYTAEAKVQVVDHGGQPVAGVPVRGFWSGDTAGQPWMQDSVTDAGGWASFPLASFQPSGPTTLAFSPAFLGSEDPASPWFVGRGGETPSFFYDQAANRAHYASQDL